MLIQKQQVGRRYADSKHKFSVAMKISLPTSIALQRSQCKILGMFVTSVNADGYHHIAATINKPQVHHNGASKPSLGDLSVNWGNITNRQQRIMQRLQKQNNSEASGFLGG